MPKIKSAKNAEPKKIGTAVDLEAWLTETESIKDKDGKETVTRKNISDTIYAEIKDGKRVKDKDGRVTSIVSPSFTVSVEIAKRRIPANKDGQPFEMEYASILPNVIEACALLVGGNTDVTVEKDKDGKETELPSVTKYFAQGYGMLARNNASAAIAKEVEGPAKGIEQAIKGLMKSKGWSYEKAKAKLALMNDD